MAEWLKAAVLKTAIPGDRDREFESPSLHQAFPSEMTGRPTNEGLTNSIHKYIFASESNFL
jgi:hypothetical protein